MPSEPSTSPESPPTTAETPSEPPCPSGPGSKKPRRMRKRVTFKPPPRPAQPVRALWEQASETERQRAHTTCTVMLEYWLARITKQEAAERLGVSPLRVWQLSQKAVSGMLAGLLKQPRKRGRPPQDPVGGEDPAKLRKRIDKLQQELEATSRLVGILRELPANRTVTSPPKPSSPKRRSKGGDRRGKKMATRRGASGRTKDAAGPEAPDERAR